MQDTYRPMVPQRLLLEMALEKALEDDEKFSEWFYAETMSPSERRPSAYFAPISSQNLLKEILLKPKATNEQLAEAWRELRQRYLEDNQDAIQREFSRLMAEEEAQ